VQSSVLIKPLGVSKNVMLFYSTMILQLILIYYGAYHVVGQLLRAESAGLIGRWQITSQFSMLLLFANLCFFWSVAPLAELDTTSFGSAVFQCRYGIARRLRTGDAYGRFKKATPNCKPRQSGQKEQIKLSLWQMQFAL
jgi:hypothetical protein